MNTPYGRQTIDRSDIKAVVDALQSEFLTTGPKIKEFENKFAHFVHAKYAVSVSNGTAALHLACLAVDLKAGEELITTPMTFAASANCALYCGAKPVFVDINENGLIDENLIEQKITKRTKIIIPVHYGGLPCNLKKIKTVAKKHNLIVIEDACHALGSEYLGTKIGDCKYSDMAIFSFHPVKHITTGEGGMITTNSKELYEKLLLLRSHGITKDPEKLVKKNEGPWFYEMQDLGFNYRLTDFQCALGISQLSKVEKFIEKRIKIAKKYDDAFVKNLNIKIIKTPKGLANAYHLYVIRVKDKVTRLNLFNHLKTNGIYCQVHYIPVYWHPYYQKLGYKKGICPKTEEFYERIISIPIYPDLRSIEQKKVIKLIKDFMFYKKTVVKKIAGKRIYLKKLVLENATQKYRRWLNDPLVNRYLETHQASIDDIKEYIMKQEINPNAFFVGIFDTKKNEHIGNMKLEPINWEEKTAVFGMLIGDKNYWGKGFGTEAAKLLVNYAFDKMELAEITLGVYSENKAAIRVYEKVGFKVLKIEKKVRQKDNHHSNKIMMVIKKSINNPVDKLVLGTVQFGLNYGVNNFVGKPSRKKSLEMLVYAYNHGIRTFDTASAYGDAEEILGEFSKKLKLDNQIKIITKLKPNILPDFDGDVYETILSNLKESLTHLNRKYVDGYLLHTPGYIREPKVVAALNKLKMKGLVKNIGVSIYEKEDAIFAAGLKEIDFIQIPYSILDQRMDDKAFWDLTKKNKITIFARSAFLQGLFFMRDKKIPDHLKKVKTYFKEIDAIIKKHHITRQQAALLFSYLNKNIDYVVFGVDNIAQLTEDLEIVKNCSNSDKFIAELKDKFANIEKSIIFPSLWKK